MPQRFPPPGGEGKGGGNQEQLKQETTRLIKYFLAAMTVPEKDLWVNLSPYEKDRIIAPNLGQTQMGRDMLAQDYILKQLTASLIYPEKHLGKEFWDRVYAKAQQMYGTTQIPVNTFNKVWIVADRADVYERGNVAYIVGAHLKVMLEEDYLAKEKNQSPTRGHVQDRTTKNVSRAPASVRQEDPSRLPTNEGLQLKASQGNNRPPNAIATQIIKQIILPEIEHEVNAGQNFAPLRQMFYSMILASWYKMALKDAILTQIYGNQSKVKVGVNQDDPKANEEIFQRYLKAYKKGVYNYIKEEPIFPPPGGEGQGGGTIPRKYFSGGTNFAMLASPTMLHRHSSWNANASTGEIFIEAVNTTPKSIKPKDAAMKTQLQTEIESVIDRVYVNIYLNLGLARRENNGPVFLNVNSPVKYGRFQIAMAGAAEKFIEFAKCREGSRVFDFGSGDGWFDYKLAAQGVHVDGMEEDQFPYSISSKASGTMNHHLYADTSFIRSLNAEQFAALRETINRVHLKQGDIFTNGIDLSSYDVVYLYYPEPGQHEGEFNQKLNDLMTKREGGLKKDSKLIILRQGGADPLYFNGLYLSQYRVFRTKSAVHVKACTLYEYKRSVNMAIRPADAAMTAEDWRIGDIVTFKDYEKKQWIVDAFPQRRTGEKMITTITIRFRKKEYRNLTFEEANEFLEFVSRPNKIEDKLAKSGSVAHEAKGVSATGASQQPGNGTEGKASLTDGAMMTELSQEKAAAAFEQIKARLRSKPNPVVVIVDNDPVESFLLKERIRQRNSKIIFVDAVDGKQALQIIQARNDIDLIFSDQDMPNMDGRSLFKELRQSSINIDFVLRSDSLGVEENKNYEGGFFERSKSTNYKKLMEDFIPDTAMIGGRLEAGKDGAMTVNFEEVFGKEGASISNAKGEKIYVFEDNLKQTHVVIGHYVDKSHWNQWKPSDNLFVYWHAIFDQFNKLVELRIIKDTLDHVIVYRDDIKGSYRYYIKDGKVEGLVHDEPAFPEPVIDAQKEFNSFIRSYHLDIWSFGPDSSNFKMAIQGKMQIALDDWLVSKPLTDSAKKLNQELKSRLVHTNYLLEGASVFVRFCKVKVWLGIHGRTASRIVKLANANPDIKIIIRANGIPARADSLLQLWALGAVRGTEISIEVESSYKERSEEIIKQFIDIITVKLRQGYIKKTDVGAQLAERDAIGLKSSAAALQKPADEGGDMTLYLAALRLGVRLPEDSSGPDKAQLSQNGGIDFDRSKMQMNVSKDAAMGGVRPKFDPAMIQRIKRDGFDGLEFKIESIVPVTNLPQILGLNLEPADKPKQELLAKV